MLWHVLLIYSIYMSMSRFCSLLGQNQAVIAVKTKRQSLNCEKYDPVLGKIPNGNPGIGQKNKPDNLQLAKIRSGNFYSRQKTLEKFTYC